jgi:hypothetical protein
MIRPWSRRLLTLAIAMFCGLVDATVVSWLPGNWQSIRWAFPFVVLLAIFSTRERSLVAAIGGGFMLDLFLPSSLAFVTARFMLVAFIVHVLGARLVSNRSLIGIWTLVITAFLSDRSISFGIQVFMRQLGTNIIPEVHAVFWAELAWLFVVVTATFIVFAAFTRRFLPSVYTHRGRSEMSHTI